MAPIHDPTWPAAPAALRKHYFELVVKLALQFKRQELSQGLDAMGVKMAPLALSTILHRKSFTKFALPWNPPLIPAGPFSRTAAWLKGQAFTDRAVFWWANGWGRILSYHRAGGPKLPIRDVFGISSKAITGIRVDGIRWWTGARMAVSTHITRQTDVLQQGKNIITLGGNLEELKRALREGRFTGWHKPGDLP